VPQQLSAFQQYYVQVAKQLVSISASSLATKTKQNTGKAANNNQQSQNQARQAVLNYVATEREKLLATVQPFEQKFLHNGESGETNNTVPLRNLCMLHMSSPSLTLYSLDALDMHVFMDELLAPAPQQHQLQNQNNIMNLPFIDKVLLIAQTLNDWKPTKHLIENEIVVFQVTEARLAQSRALRTQRLHAQVNTAIKQYVHFHTADFFVQQKINKLFLFCLMLLITM